MQILGNLVEELVGAVEAGEVFWAGLGTFSMYVQRRMPGFPGYRRLMFRPSERLFLVLNPNEAPPVRDAPASEWAADAALAARVANLIVEALVDNGEVKVPGLGSFWNERRKTTTDDFAYVLFRADPDLLRRLNPADKAFDAAMAVEWPQGIPEEAPRGEG